MKIHRYFDSRILRLPPRIDQPAARAWLEQGWRILKLLSSVDYSASRVTRARLSVLRGWGLLSLELDLEEVFGVPSCFPGVLITGSCCLLDSVRWIQGMTPITLTAVGVARMTCPNWLKWGFFCLIFNPCLISWLIRMNPIAQVNRCPFWDFLGDMAEDFSRAWRCRDISRPASFWWSPLSFFITGWSPI